MCVNGCKCNDNGCKSIKAQASLLLPMYDFLLNNLTKITVCEVIYVQVDRHIFEFMTTEHTVFYRVVGNTDWLERDELVLDVEGLMSLEERLVQM